MNWLEQPAPAIILARPQMPENVGAVARAMLNFGLTELRLVRPEFGWPNAKAVASASGAHVVMDGLRFFASVPDAAHDLRHLYATTARPRDLVKPVLDPVAMGKRLQQHLDAGRACGLLFGPERTGLDNDELALCDGIITISLNPEFSSLNLAQAVLLCIYQWRQAVGLPALPSPEGDTPASKGELQAMLDHLVLELDEVGFFRSQTRRQSLTRTLATMFERRQLTSAEVQLMRGLIKELRHGPFRP